MAGFSDSKPIKNLRSEFQGLKKDLSETAKSLKDVALSYEKLSESQQWFVLQAKSLGLIKNAAKATSDELRKLVALQEAFGDSGTSMSQADWLQKYGRDVLNGKIAIESLYTEETKLEKTQERRSKTTKKEADETKKLAKEAGKLKSILEGIAKSGQIKVSINNKGFEKVLNEMSSAINNFSRRKGNKDKNFFEEAFGTKGERRDSLSGIAADLKTTSEMMSQVIGANITDGLQDRISKAIANGITKGISDGITMAASQGNAVQMLDAISKGMRLTPMGRERLAESALGAFSGKLDPFREREARIRHNAKARIEQRKITEKYKSKLDMKNASDRLMMDEMRNMMPDLYRSTLENFASIQQTRATIESKNLEKIEQAEEEKRKQRERWYKNDARYRAEMLQYAAKELTNLDKQVIKYRELEEQYERLFQQAMNNKGNQDAHLRTLREMMMVNREMLKNVYLQAKGYDDIKKKADALHKRLSATASFFQRMSVLLGSSTRLFSTIRSSLTTLYGKIRNGIRRLGSYLMRTLRTSVSLGLEQYEKLEKAHVGYQSFYGPQADNVLRQVRSEALKTPIVNSGDLAEYVMQLAPVSGGDPQLAINAALGALKAIQYGGADSSEMEYVVKNIRDVVAKGKATAIDIRQFNRAMPALEKAIEQAGLNQFLSTGSDGEKSLKIDKNNVKQILTMFARLNTDEDSPVKNIDQRMLETLSGLKQVLSERRVTLMQNVFEGSGAADLVKSVMKTLNNADLFAKMEEFLTQRLKAVVDFLRSVDWKMLGDQLKVGVARLGEAFKGIKTGILGALGVEDANASISKLLNDLIANEGFWERLWSLIAKFIEGFSGGVSQMVKWGKAIVDFMNGIDKGVLEEAIKWIGYIASPMGRMWITLGNIMTQTFSGLRGLFATMDSATQWFNRNRLTRIKNAAGQYATVLTEQGIEGMAASKQNYRLIGSKKNPVIIGNTNFYRDGMVQGYQTRKGKAVDRWSDLKIWDRPANIGLGNTLKEAASRAFSKIADVGGRALKSGMIFMLGNSITEVVSGIVSQSNPAVGEMVKNFGTVASAAIGVGSQFGVLAGAAAGAITAFAKLVGASKDLEETQKKYADSLNEAAISGLRRDLITSTLDNLQAAGLYDPYEEYSEDAYKAVIDAAKTLNDYDMRRDPEAAMNRLYSAYMSRRGQTAAGASIEAWANKNLQGYTEITSGDTGTLKRVAEALAHVKAIELSEETVKELGDNYKSWQGYLKQQGFGFNTVETLNNFDGTLEQLTEKYNEWNDKKIDLKPYIYDEATGERVPASESHVWEQAMKNWGFWWDDGEGAWTTDMIIKARIEREKSGFDAAKENIWSDGYQFGDHIRTGWAWGADQVGKFGKGAAEWIGSWWPFKQGGGMVRPIYRATGGPALGVDTVPVMAQPGEFIVRRSSVSKAGLNALQALNRGDLTSAAASLGTKVNNSWNNSRNWSNIINNNQRSSRNQINIFTRNNAGRLNTYYGLGNRIALA